MGTVLEMSVTGFLPRSRTATALLLGALLALSGCGNDPAPLGALALGALKGLIPGQGAEPAPVDLRKALTRAALDQSQTPLLLAESEATGLAGVMAAVADNGSWRSWRGADNVGLGFRGGLLGRTQGLGEDLMSADLDEPLAHLTGRGSGSTAVRVHRYLDGERQEVTRSYVCRYGSAGAETITIIGARHVTRHLVETCRGPDREFRNDYWMGGDGMVWKSRQWVGPDVGHLILERLVR